MRTSSLLCALLLLAISCFGQTSKPSTAAHPAKSKALLACEAQNKANADGWRDAIQGWDATSTQLSAATKKYDDAMTVLRYLQLESPFQVPSQEQRDQLAKQLDKVSPGAALELGASIEADRNRLLKVAQDAMAHDSQTVDKYNALLADYKDYVQRVGIQLAQVGQASRINNALAIYQLMPKYTPPQTINIQVTDCTRLPALCVH